MTPRTGTWGEVEKGTYIRDKNDKVWRVLDVRGNQLLLLRPNDERHIITRPLSHLEVTILDLTHDDAVSIVQRELGAEVIATKDKGDPWRVPPLPHRNEDVHSHMSLLHGVYTRSGAGSKSIKRLLEIHREDHEDPASHAYQQHRHLVDWETPK